jgi:hypothetical protein
MIFVFGSNLAGRHGKGAALYALQNKGAIRGKGEGIQGQSYAIPTKDEKLRPLSLERVQAAIGRFCNYARENPHMSFALTPVGCGLAGFPKRDIWGMLKFHGLPPNVYLTSSWLDDA